jgi:MFS family permease
MAIGAIIVPKLNLIMDLVCDQYYASSPDPISGPMDPGQQPDRCRTDAVSSRSSLFLLYGNLCAGILSAITSPKLGALSDRHGRKKLLVCTTFGALLAEVLTILAAKYPETVHVNWILVGYALDGLAGSFIVGMALAYSYASDCTSPQKRNVAFGYFSSCLWLRDRLARKVRWENGSRASDLLHCTRLPHLLRPLPHLCGPGVSVQG